MRRFSSLFAAAAVTAGLVGSVHAASVYNLENITHNDAGDAAIGENQLRLIVNQFSSSQVEFGFTNTGPQQSVVASIYFDDDRDLLKNTLSFTNAPPGVVFDNGATPPVLPGGNAVNFNVDFGAAADNPKPQKGIGPGEALYALIDYTSSGSYSDVISALNSGDLRIGEHVIAFADQGSESFVTHGPMRVVPTPAALSMGVSLLGGLLLRRRRRSCP